MGSMKIFWVKGKKRGGGFHPTPSPFRVIENWENRPNFWIRPCIMYRGVHTAVSVFLRAVCVAVPDNIVVPLNWKQSVGHLLLKFGVLPAYLLSIGTISFILFPGLETFRPYYTFWFEIVGPEVGLQLFSQHVCRVLCCIRISYVRKSHRTNW